MQQQAAEPEQLQAAEAAVPAEPEALKAVKAEEPVEKAVAQVVHFLPNQVLPIKPWELCRVL